MSDVVEAAHLPPPMKRSDAYAQIEEEFKRTGKLELYVADIAKALNISRNSAWNFLVTGEREGKFKSRVVYPPLRVRAYSLVKQRAGKRAAKHE